MRTRKHSYGDNNCNNMNAVEVQRSRKHALARELLEVELSRAVPAHAEVTDPMADDSPCGSTHSQWPLVKVSEGQAAARMPAGMCASLRMDVVVVSCNLDHCLHVHSLSTGRFRHTVGSRGAGRGQFNIVYGGLAMTTRDTVLVAEVWSLWVCVRRCSAVYSP